MNMKQAEQQNLTFHGATADEWNAKEIKELKEKAKEIRKLGFRAICAKSTYQEWGNGSYVLMVDKEYLDYEDANSHIYYIQNEEEFIKKFRKKQIKEFKKLK